MVRALVVGAAIFLAAALPAAAQTTPIVRMECTSANFPNCGTGWTANAGNAYYSRQLLLGTAPLGRNAVRINFTPVSTHAQFYFGWGTSFPATPQGASRFVRIRIRLVPGLYVVGNDGPWTSKFIIMGDGGDESSRIITELRPVTTDSDLAILVQRNIDGGAHSAGANLTIGPWHNVQFEAKSSSGQGVNDGRIKLWIDGANTNYAAPTRQSELFYLSSSAWSNVGVARFSNTTLRTGGQLGIEVSDFELDDAFDPQWNVGSPNMPSAPSNLRVVPGLADSIPLAMAAIGLLVVGRVVGSRRR